MYVFTINISPRGWELEEGIPNELCRVLDGICVLVCVCMCVFYSLQEHGKKPLTVGSLFSPRSHILAMVQEVRTCLNKQCSGH